ncbi:hypothetical protein EVAR_84302_1 [Eumeta japonica]|uniref:Uncharacterized protein n=1 Tax=Eumeta variegata TaxID=151549 RepID=A0A4C1ZX62_EUMVA|nr:hypothetical protein EVAR_84302_1 [Eumeta japonica]
MRYPRISGLQANCLLCREAVEWGSHQRVDGNRDPCTLATPEDALMSYRQLWQGIRFLMDGDRNDGRSEERVIERNSQSLNERQQRM